MRYKIKFAAILAFVAWSCGPSSYITHSWKAPGTEPAKFKKIIVLGMIREADRATREKMEQHFVNDLKALGYNAVCSCNEYNPAAFEGMNEKEAITWLRSSGADAVLTITLLNKERERYYIPGRINYSPYYVYQNRFYGYYRTMHERIHGEGYYAFSTRYFWESNLYDLGTNSLLYTVQSESFDPSSAEALGHEYAGMIVADMVKQRVIASQQQAAPKFM